MRYILHQCSIGQKKKGVEIGPFCISKYLNLSPISSNTIAHYNENIEKAFESYGYKDSFKLIDEYEKDNTSWISLGGDHSIAASTISPILLNDPETLIVWIDAHADLNTPESSLSGNSHGMPVAYLFGLLDKKPPVILKPEQIIYIGLRDLDLFEIETIKKLGIQVFTSHKDYHSFSSDLYLPSILSYIMSLRRKRIHVSLDIDGLDPKDMPCTGTKSPFGLSIDFVCELLNEIKNISMMKSMDIVEYNPLLGDDNENKITLKNIERIIDLFE